MKKGFVFLLIIIVLLIVHNSSVSIVAAKKSQDINVGRYQISSWAIKYDSQGYEGIIGYFIIDTATGEIVKKDHEFMGLARIGGGRDQTLISD